MCISLCVLRFGQLTGGGGNVVEEAVFKPSSALNQLSRSLSFRMVSRLLPVRSAVISARRFFMSRISSAWVRISDAVPPIPPRAGA